MHPLQLGEEGEGEGVKKFRKNLCRGGGQKF